MKLLSFTGSKADWPSRLGERLIRFRLRGPYAHSEVMFEPGDGVDALMPDGTCEPINGAYWCASSVWLERVPAWSPRRAGHLGGVRFKRVVPDPMRYDVDSTGTCDPLHAAQVAHRDQGMPYDLQLILGFMSWLIPGKDGRAMCSEECAEMLGLPTFQAWRFDPNNLPLALRAFRQNP